MSYELYFTGLEYDNGYGDQCADIVVALIPIFEDCSFDHAFGTKHQECLTGADIDYGVITLLDNDGGEVGEVELDEVEQLYNLVGKETVLEALQEAIFKKGR